MFKNQIEFISLNAPDIKDFSKERNDALKKAKKDWVFFVDSDESLSEELKQDLETRNPGDYSSFYVFRKNYFLGKYSGTDKIIRLAKLGSGLWQRAVHEVWNVNGKVGTLRGYLVHNTAQTVSEMVLKVNSYSSIHARENIKEGKKFSVYKLVLYPAAKYFQSIFSGRGVILSMLQSFHSFLSWGKQWELQKE